MPDLTDLNPNEIVKMAQAVEILCPKGFTTLAESYIRLKTHAHVDYYRDVQNVRSLIHRLLVKRPLWYHSRTNVCNANDVDSNPEKYITKEECLLSALLQVATETYFINDCNRENYGRKKGYASKYYTNKALIVGSVGCRFEEEEEHEWRHMYVMETQNTSVNGYGNRNGNNHLLNIFQEFYDEEFPLCIAKKEFFNYNVFMKNMAKKAEIFFHCGLSHQNEKQIVVFRVVGLGFGVWAPGVEMINYELAYQSVFIRALYNVSKIFQSMTIILDFIWPQDKIQNDTIILEPDGKKRRNNIADNNRHYISFFEAYQNKPPNVLIYTSKQNPASKVFYGDRLYDDDDEVFLVTQYAWDSRSYPGNEFFQGAFAASGDPAAACASMITAFQNPEVNIEAFAADTMQVLELQ